MSTAPMIEVRGVTKMFGDKAAVLDVDARVAPGRCFAWLGPTGSGKTTLIQMLLGLARPTRGRVKVCGFDVPGDTTAALARVGSVVEAPPIYPQLSGRGNLKVWAAQYDRAARRRIPELLDRVGLTERADDKVADYSRGMRQRLGVAKALLNDPELLILDEPTNGLDPVGVADVRRMIRSFVEDDGRTVFVSSHLLDEVQKVADDVAIVQAGRLVTQVRIEELVDAGAPRFTARVGAPDRAASMLAVHPLVREVRPDGSGGLEIYTTRGDDAAAIEITRLLNTSGSGLISFTRVATTLEQRFLDLTAVPARPADVRAAALAN